MARNLQYCWTVSWHTYMPPLNLKGLSFYFILWAVSPCLLRWRRGDVCSVHMFNFFFSQCAFSEMVFSSWYSSYGWHLQSPLKAAWVRTWSAIFRAIQIVGAHNFGFLLGLLQSWLLQGRISVVLISLCATTCYLFCLANLLSKS